MRLLLSPRLLLRLRPRPRPRPRLRLRRRRPSTFGASSPHAPTATSKKRKRRRKRERQSPGRRHLCGTPSTSAPADAVVSGDLGSVASLAGKYWAQRHSIFSLYDRGVLMDAEGWYSATPEAVAAAHAARAAPSGLVVDAFAGVGGNSIQFAARGCYVIAVEIDACKVEYAKHNARIYGVEDRIEFVIGDFFQLAPFLKGDTVFLSPPWGGPSYKETPTFTLDMLKPKDGYSTFQVAQRIAPNIIFFLPRNVDISQVEELSWLSSPPLDFESEESCVQHRVKGITAYFQDTASTSTAC